MKRKNLLINLLGSKLIVDDILKLFKKLPTYALLSIKGPKHNPLFKISVSINKSKKYTGSGNSKKNAEQDAAEKLLKDINII